MTLWIEVLFRLSFQAVMVVVSWIRRISMNGFYWNMTPIAPIDPIADDVGCRMSEAEQEVPGREVCRVPVP
jgi:hypothetical protein